MDRFFVRTSIAVVLCHLSLSMPVLAEAAQANRDPGRIPYRSVLPLFESTADRTTLIIARQVAQARLYLYRQNPQAAGRELAAARRLMNSVAEDLTAGPLKNRIRIARLHLTYDPPAKVLGEFPQMFSELHRISVYLPTDKAAIHLERARKLLEHRESGKAADELSRAEALLVTVNVESPLSVALAASAQAQSYLNLYHYRKADRVLARIEEQLMTVNAYLASPLHGARENSWLALGNRSTAGRHLSDTRKNLEQAGVQEKQGRAEIGQVTQQVARVEKKVEEKGKLEESELKGLWEECKALEERAVAYLSTRLTEEETTLKGDSDLIEASLHLDFAETYQLTTQEPEKADQELSVAYRLVKKAENSPLAGPTDRKTIAAIGRAILKLQENPGERDVNAQVGYERTKQELRALQQRI
ncbi:YfdX family protein [Geomonas limicola]|nr:YfdX family protein [Geomonas limicola]